MVPYAYDPTIYITMYIYTHAPYTGIYYISPYIQVVIWVSTLQGAWFPKKIFSQICIHAPTGKSLPSSSVLTPYHLIGVRSNASSFQTLISCFLHFNPEWSAPQLFDQFFSCSDGLPVIGGSATNAESHIWSNTDTDPWGVLLPCALQFADALKVPPKHLWGWKMVSELWYTRLQLNINGSHWLGHAWAHTLIHRKSGSEGASWH